MSRTRSLAGVLLTGALIAVVILTLLAVVGFVLASVVAVVSLVALAAFAAGTFALVTRLAGRSGGSGSEDAAHPASDGRPDDRLTDDALAELRRRYAAGDLSEAQFEGRVERLLVDDADADGDDARDVLELRYARGELTDEQFDRKRARLDGTRTVEYAEREFDRGSRR